MRESGCVSGATVCVDLSISMLRSLEMSDPAPPDSGKAFYDWLQSQVLALYLTHLCQPSAIGAKDPKSDKS